MNASRLFFLVGIALAFSCAPDFDAPGRLSLSVDHRPLISPDYIGITLPPNIAPLNFRVMESGTAFSASFSADNGSPIVVFSRSGRIHIPLAKWRRLLDRNRGATLRITVMARDTSGRWRRFSSIENRIATEPVDPYLTYRSLGFLYNFSNDLRIHERHLESFRDRTLLSTKNFYWSCVNCHTPESNDPQRTVVHYRSNDFGSGTVITSGSSAQNIGAKLGYTAWRPGGDHIAFSLSRVRQCFHAVGNNPIDDYDVSSELFVYDVAQKRLLDEPRLYRSDMIQTWPSWSPDGRFLYYCGGPVLWTDGNKVPPDGYDRQRCSLFRIAFNGTDGTFGDIDTVLSAESTGLSISQPRLSPDGRFVLFCMHAFGPYPITQPSSDLYLLELANGRYRRLGVSSDESESWHGWSKNGRWIVFSSKRGGGIFTRLYFAHIDSQGNSSRPFILPQKECAFYESHIRSYNVPELAVAAAPVSQRGLLRAIRGTAIDVPLPGKRTAPDMGEEPSAEWAARKKTVE